MIFSRDVYMLEVFRKYQRHLFIFIAIMIIASFSFFGTFSTFSQAETRKDSVLAHAVDGSPIMLSEVRALARFLSTDREDAGQPGVSPNLCNDGVIRHDLLRTGIADLIADSYFESLKTEFELRLDRAKRFRPYVHPDSPFIRAEAVWAQFLPAINREIAQIQEEKEAAPSTFARFSRLYQQQSALTPETLRRILFFLHQQQGLKIDPALQYADLSLFGFHSLTDWFGRDFLAIAAEFILNAAALAEEKGYVVSLEEAKGDLVAHFQNSLQRLQADPSESGISFSQHLRSLGFDEKTASELWRKVLLFRRYFQGVSQSAFLDRLPFKDFTSYAHETARIVQYQWPSSLHLSSLQDLIEFEIYIEAVAPPLEDPLDLPSQFYALEQIGENFPELVQSSYQAKLKKASLPQAALRASVKEVWDWELDEKNWDAMKARFGYLSQGCTREERFQCLEKLPSWQRSQVDNYARLRLLDAHSEWIEEAMAALPSSETTLSVSKASASLPEIEKPWRLNALLQKAAGGSEEAKKELLSYTDDGMTLFRIEEASLVKEPRVLTFEEARKQGLLAKISERSLSAAYPKIRSKHPAPFQTKEGSWKPFSEARVEVAKRVYRDLFNAIERLEERSWTESDYARYRLLPSTQRAYADLRKGKGERWEAKETRDALENQFRLEKSELEIQRVVQDDWMKENAFTLTPGAWSSIRVPENGAGSFFYLIERKPSIDPLPQQIALGKELIAADAQRYLAEKLLASIFKSHSIVIPEETQ